jgi:hypothetical protein
MVYSSNFLRFCPEMVDGRLEIAGTAMAPEYGAIQIRLHPRALADGKGRSYPICRGILNMNERDWPGRGWLGVKLDQSLGDVDE